MNRKKRSPDFSGAGNARRKKRFTPMVSRLLHLMIINVLTTTVALCIGSAHLQPCCAT